MQTNIRRFSVVSWHGEAQAVFYVMDGERHDLIESFASAAAAENLCRKLNCILPTSVFYYDITYRLQGYTETLYHVDPSMLVETIERLLFSAATIVDVSLSQEAV